MKSSEVGVCFKRLAAVAAFLFAAATGWGMTPDYFVEYVESTNGTTYVNTGICPIPSQTRMVVTLSPTEAPNANRSVFGARASTSDAGADANYVLWNGSQFRLDWTRNKNLKFTPVLGAVYSFDGYASAMSVNCVEYVGGSAKSGTVAEKPLYLFAANNNGAVMNSGLKQRLYGARIYQNGLRLSANYIPCVKNDGSGNLVAGLYDTVSGEIVYPASGSLKAGPVVGQGSNKTFVGGVNDDWDLAANWAPAGLPASANNVVIPAGKIVTATNAITVAALNVSTGALLTVGCEVRYRYTSGNIYQLTNHATSLTVAVAGDMDVGGAFALDGRDVDRANVSLTVGGDLTLAGTARMSVYAGTFSCTKEEYTFAAIYAAPTLVSVSGDILIGGSSVVYPCADATTGAAVKFVCRNFTLDTSAGVTAVNSGWNWIKYRDDNIAGYVEKTADPRATYWGAAYNSKRYHYILCPKWNDIWASSGNIGYGGGSSAYGYKYAPFLPGSPSGCRDDPPTRGGGAIWVRSTGTMTVNGTITASGSGSLKGGCSGGGIWLCAKKGVFGGSAVLKSEGSNNSYTAATGGGGGGRIAVCLGVTDDDVAYLATGEDPAEGGLNAVDGCTLCTCSVLGGTGGQKDSSGTLYRGASGSVATVYGGLADVAVTITASPSEMGTVFPDYGPHMYEQNSQQTFTAAEVAYAAPDVRYVCKGYVVSNQTEEVARGSANELTFNVGTKAVTLYWVWGDCEKGVTVSVPANATVFVDGEKFTESGFVWKHDGDTVAMRVVPDDGYELLCWEGEVVYGVATNAELTLAVSDMRKVTPLVRPIAAATARRWLGKSGETKCWNVADNWDPVGVPGTADDVEIAAGTCLVSNYAACASLTLSGSASLKVAATASSKLEEAALVVNGDLLMTNTASLVVAPKNYTRHGRLGVAGDLTMSGSASLTVSGGPIDGDRFTMLKGTGFVTVGGDLSVGGGATVVPNVEPYTGGPVVFRVGGNFSLTTNASFKAYANGFARVSGRDPITLGPGWGLTHVIGAGYGGCGGGYGGYYGTTYGKSYGFALAPYYPGSPAGDYSSSTGGGLIRIHVAGRAAIAGRLDASATEKDDTASSASGGGIWVTAGGKMTFAPGVVLKARGGFQCTGAGQPGAGGRIALAQRMTESQSLAIAADGEYHGPGRAKKHVFDQAAFQALPGCEGVTIDVLGGNGLPGDRKGSFSFIDGTPQGLLLLVR